MLMLILNVGKLKVNMSPAPEDGNTLKIISESQTCFFFIFFFIFCLFWGYFLACWQSRVNDAVLYWCRRRVRWLVLICGRCFLSDEKAFLWWIKKKKRNPLFSVYSCFWKAGTAVRNEFQVPVLKYWHAIMSDIFRSSESNKSVNFQKHWKVFILVWLTRLSVWLMWSFRLVLVKERWLFSLQRPYRSFCSVQGLISLFWLPEDRLTDTSQGHRQTLTSLLPLFYTPPCSQMLCRRRISWSVNLISA